MIVINLRRLISATYCAEPALFALEFFYRLGRETIAIPKVVLP